MKNLYTTVIEIKVISKVEASSKAEAERMALEQFNEWNIPKSAYWDAHINSDVDLISLAYPRINVNYSEYQEKVFVCNGNETLFSYSSLGAGLDLLNDESKLLTYTIDTFSETLMDMARDKLLPAE